MRPLKAILAVMFFLLTSCGGIDFVYKDESKNSNPLLNKTEFFLGGKEIPFIAQNALLYFGQTNNPSYNLNINIDVIEKKKSVQKNQALSKLDYELGFNYNLFDANECLLYNKYIVTRFSYIPKSAGYNFGSDQSLDKLYDLATEENFEYFISLIENKDLICK